MEVLYSMTLDLTPIENLNNIIINNSCFQKKIRRINKTKKMQDTLINIIISCVHALLELGKLFNI